MSKHDLTFFLNVRGDVDQLEICLDRLRRVYPTSRLIVRADGDSDPAIETLSHRYSGICHYGEWLFPIERGGEVVHEMLRLFLAEPTEYFIKIDPDTRIARAFDELPTDPCVFGTVQRTAGLFSIQGGCLGMTHDVARALYDSRFFLGSELAHCPPPWTLGDENLAHRPVELGLTSIDWVVGWACRRMNVRLVDWREIMSEWLRTPSNDDRRYAVTHPHKPGSDPGAETCAVRFYDPGALDLL